MHENATLADMREIHRHLSSGIRRDRDFAQALAGLRAALKRKRAGSERSQN